MLFFDMTLKDRYKRIQIKMSQNDVRRIKSKILRVYRNT